MSRLMLVAGGGGAFTLPPPHDDLATWRAALAAPPATFIVIADSISAAWGVPSGTQWPTLLDALFGTDADHFNYASPGRPSAYFLDTSTYNTSISLPDLVVIELGVNDMATGVTKAAFKANILQIISDVRGAMATDPSFLLLIAYDIGTSYGIAWSEYADAMDEIAAADDDVSSYDLRTAFGAPSTTLLQVDLVHPNTTGHALIADLMFAALT